jgi:hypothetical protein
MTPIMTAPFDPVSWLLEFQSLGGEVALTRGRHFSMTRHLAAMTAAQINRSWALQMELSEDQTKLAAVWSLMQQQRAA